MQQLIQKEFAAYSSKTATQPILEEPIEQTARHSVLDSAILIVDDAPLNRLFLEKVLLARGYTKIRSAQNAVEALECLSAFKPEIIILDIMMPGIDGFECCERIRSRAEYKDIPILIQTALTEPELRVKAFHKGATDFISKPIFPEELCARVQVHLEKRRCLAGLLEYKSRMEAELESARDLQRAILPGPHEIEHIRDRFLLDIASSFEPSLYIGGDFWGVKNLLPNQTAFWLVDFSGHGVASALNAFRLQAYIKEYSTIATRPGDYLSSLNDKLLHLLMRGQFATMFYGVMDTQTHLLHYACACAPHPIMLHAATGHTEVIDGTGAPLGVGIGTYETQTTTFSPGDVLLLYSDALVETPNKNGEYITEEMLMTWLSEYHGAKSANLRAMLLERFHEHTGNVHNDDLTIVVCIRSTL